MQESRSLTTTEMILDSVADGVFTVDHEFLITSFNRAAEQLTGVPRSDALGRPCCEVLRASICESACALRQTLATGRPIVNKAVFILDSHGNRVPISISTAVLLDANGNVIGGVETFRDLSFAEQLYRELESSDRFVDIVGRSRAMRQIFQLLPQIAESPSTVLIEGPSGTGKELIARAIHRLSPRRNKPFVAVNCSALPDTLLESELFGYKAGAFTDAKHDKPGRFALADGGTLFLDEIGDISPALQSRLLRVLQERVIEPLGGIEPVPVDVRIIAATHRPLVKLVRKGLFREDLFYRINVVRIELPPLRERREDIPLLIEYFVSKFNRLHGKGILGVSDEVLARLMDYDYPGNVRELENIIEHAFVLCRGHLIELEHLPPSVRGEGDLRDRSLTKGLTLKEMERVLIRDALRRHQGHRVAAARELGIHPSTLFRKMKSLGITWPEPG
ncbi:MAG TPA: sigma 54-interacting transcriptional regulator [Thermogutta sp.]|nr:sigma 54-interacting transcriptional regulator [Thermogutta sp.]HPU05905.1 sigma 54-interacting transcriptional regulator [Thermogutta sp.]HQF14360.1 sigma 54-interacting transcriptional regulator [Thermogutta sp.]